MNFSEIKEAITTANETGLDCQLNEVTGFSGKQLVGTLQRLAKGLDIQNECYLEVGVFQGMTLLSVAKANEKLSCFGIDNFSQFDPKGTNKEIIKKRAKVNSIANFSLIESDFEDAFDKLEYNLSDKQIGVYFVDGPHDYRSQLICLEFIKPYLSENAVIVIDDANYRHVRQANSDFIKANPEYTLFYENYTNHHPHYAEKANTEFKEEWWNGVNIIVRDKESVLDKAFPVTERDRSLYFNDHIIHSEKYSYLAPQALKIARGLLDFHLIDFAKGLISCFMKRNSSISKVHKGKYRSMNVFSENLPRHNFNSKLKD
jgi:tRNA G46 methylase TrmB